MNKTLLILMIALSSLMTYSQPAVNYKFLKKIDLPGDGKWDYMSVDNDQDRLYVSHGDRVHVIDLLTDKPLMEWTGLENVHGVAVNSVAGKVYVANTGSNTVIIYDAKTFEKKATIELTGGKKPDCVLFDAFSQKLFVFCGKSNDVFIIDGASDKVIATVPLGGQPEFACTDDKGLIYNNLEDKNEVVVIDAKANKIVNRFSLGIGKAPTGIAIDKLNGRIMVACEESKKVVILSTTTGKVVATAPMGDKTDGLIYEQEFHLIITSDGSGSATVIQQETPDKYNVIQTVKTRPGFKTISYERKTHRFFITGAELDKDGKTPLPNTFGVYVSSPK